MFGLKKIFYKFSIARKKKRFESQYQAGGWKGLESIYELGRNSVITGYIRFLMPKAKILDVGCGEGALCRQLGPESYSLFTGLDFSETAVANALNYKFPNSEFYAADAHTFTTEKKYDAIIFNEIAYYLKEPDVVIARYMNYLNENGFLAISIYGEKRQFLFERIDKKITPFDLIKVWKSDETFWMIKFYKKIL